jgi:hypothetical protein
LKSSIAKTWIYCFNFTTSSVSTPVHSFFYLTNHLKAQHTFDEQTSVSTFFTFYIFYLFECSNCWSTSRKNGFINYHFNCCNCHFVRCYGFSGSFDFTCCWLFHFMFWIVHFLRNWKSGSKNRILN